MVRVSGSRCELGRREPCHYTSGMAAVRRIPMAYNNVYLVEAGGERLLIDTGPDYQAARETLFTELKGAVPHAVFATHGHLDHAGLANWWEGRGVPVALAAKDLHFARGPQLGAAEERAMFEAFVAASGAPAAIQGELLSGLRERQRWAAEAAHAATYRVAGRDSRWPTGLRYEPFVPSIVLAADYTPLRAGATALLCPGHTPGNMVAVVESEGWLFSGDQLLPEITPTPAVQRAGPAPGFERFQSLPRFVESLERLAARDFSRCFPGHGQPFDNVAETIARNLSQIEVRTERVREALRATRGATLYEVCEALYPRAVARRFWQIAATVQGHLDLLEARCQLRRAGTGYELA